MKSLNWLMVALALAILVGGIKYLLAKPVNYGVRYFHTGQHRSPSDFWGFLGVVAWGA